MEKTRVTLAMPADGADRLIKLWKENPQKLAEILGFPIEDIKISEKQNGEESKLQSV